MDSNTPKRSEAVGLSKVPSSEQTLTQIDSTGFVPLVNEEGNLSGRTIAGYQLVRKIAEGGMGVVYEAIQLKLDRRVALKVLAQPLSSRPEFLKRFEREAKAAAALNHPNLVHVHDFGEENRRYYMIMELVEGEDLSAYVENHGKLSISEALDVIEQAAAALQAAYEKTIIHRDIKPSNLLMTAAGRVKVADLGLAKMLSQDAEMTATGVGIGSPYFIAPEQAADASSVDHRADIYSLGITLLFLLTGKKPFEGATPYSIVLAHVNKDLPSGAELGTDLPVEVERLVQRMSAKDPEDRYQDYATLLDDIRLVKAGTKPRLAPLPSRNRWRSAQARYAGVAVLAALLVVLGIVWFRTNFGKSSATNKEIVIVPGRSAGEGTPLVQLDREVTVPVVERREGLRPPRGTLDEEEFRPRGPRGPADREGSGPGGNPAWGVYMSVMGPPAMATQRPLEDGSLENMMKQTAGFEAQTPLNYILLINAYRQLSEAAEGSFQQREFDQKISALKVEHGREAKKAVALYAEKMNEQLRAGDKERAHAVWADFPSTLRSREIDGQIVDILMKALPDLAPSR